MSDEPPTIESLRIAVIGAGSWGTALARVAARNRHAVRLWAREPEVALQINATRRNPYYLSDVELPENLRATSSLAEALDGASFVLIVVPSHAARQVVEQMQPFLNSQQTLISATKGIEKYVEFRAVPLRPGGFDGEVTHVQEAKCKGSSVGEPIQNGL